MSVQTVYKYSTPIGQPGGIVDIAPYAIDSFTNESNDGVVKPGMGVVQGTSKGVQAKAPASGATAATFEGIVTNRRTYENTMTGGPEVKKGSTLGVMRYGRIYGLVATDEAPAYGDAVYLVVSGNDAGCFAKTSTNNVAIKGRFLSAASDGIAIIELFNQAQS